MSTASVAASAMLVGNVFAESAIPKKPNIVYILADDQGYGEARSFNPECGIPTPGIDRIAREGMRFTDAHSASAVCTPTRYALLTGRYNWRTRLQKGVLKSGVAPLIDKSTLTVQRLLKQHDYKTACIGKWHLGFRYEMPRGTKITKPKGKQGAVPIGSRVIEGPITCDFDVFYGFHHSGEMRSWIEQDVVAENFESSEQMLPRLCEESVAYIQKRGRRKDGPFFLYVPLSAPHGPIVPAREWWGKSKLGLYADFVMQTDDVVRRILVALDESGLAEDTIVFFASDNGTSPIAKIEELRKKGHDPLGGLRGHKADAWDGGHRAPFVVRWPGVIKPGSVSDDTICHNNLLATCGDILGTSLPDNAGVDSFSILPLLQGKQAQVAPTHPYVIHHSINGHFAIRQGKWKFVACKGSGGWSKGNDGKAAQLYDMSIDRSEKNNLLESRTDVARRLADLLEQAVNNGRTRPGVKQKNDVSVDIWKSKENRPLLLR
jgi:arylsulfatase A-like enzyme